MPPMQTQMVASSPSWLPVVWFLLVLALIPLVLWLLKRSPAKTLLAQSNRVVGSTYLGPGQRLLTVEVGTGEGRRWLLLGVTPHQINLLTEIPVDEAPAPVPAAKTFAQLLRRQGGT